MNSSMCSQMFSPSLLYFRGINQMTIRTYNNSGIFIDITWVYSYSGEWTGSIKVGDGLRGNSCGVDIDRSMDIVTRSGSNFSVFGEMESFSSLDFWGFYWYTIVVDDWDVLGIGKDSSATSVVDETVSTGSSFSMGSKMGSFSVLNLGGVDGVSANNSQVSSSNWVTVDQTVSKRYSVSLGSNSVVMVVLDFSGSYFRCVQWVSIERYNSWGNSVMSQGCYRNGITDMTQSPGMGSVVGSSCVLNFRCFQWVTIWPQN